MTDYIYIPNWDGKKDKRGFQHYGKRRPAWIKNYIALLDNDDYRDLSYHDRAVLHGLWLLTARQGLGRVRADLGELSGMIGVRVRQLDSLIQAGFIEIRDSKALAPVYQDDSPEVEVREEVEEEFPPNPPQEVGGTEEIWDSEKHDYAKPGSRANGDNPRAVADELERARKLKRLAEIRLGRAREQYAIWVEDLGLKFAEHTLRDAFPDLADTILKESA